MKLHPIKLLRFMGFLDGFSLLLLLFISMPLKYIWDLPQFVAVNGAVHGGIFVVYVLTIIFVQIRIQWNGFYSFLALLVAFIPFGNFVYDVKLRKLEHQLSAQPFKYIWIIYLIIFFSFFDLFVQLPVMSTYALSLGASTFVAGIVVGLYSFTNTFGNIFSGILTDKIGAYKMLVVGLILSVLSLFSYQLVQDPATLLLIRAIHGFSSGFITPAAFALLANIRREEEQGSGSAFTGSFVGLAAIIGPATGGILASKMLVPDVFSIVAVSGLLLVAALILFVKNKTKLQQQGQQLVHKLVWSERLIEAYIGAFFLMFSQGALSYLLPLHVESIGYSSRLSGTLLSMFGIVAVLIFISPINKIFDRLQAKISLLIGISILGISQILIGMMDTALPLYFVLALYGVGFSFTFPAINKLLTEATTQHVRGKAYGYFYAFFSIGTVAGSFILGALNLTGTPGFTFTGCVLFFFSLLILVTFLFKKQNKNGLA